MIVAATLAPASAQPPHGNATKRGRSVVTAEVVKPAKRLVAVAVAPSQPVPATVVAAAKPRACVVAVRSSACTSVATATREEQAERLEQQLERLREEQQRRRQAEQARGQVVHQAVQLREEAASAHAAVQAAARLLPSHYREVFLRRCSALRPQPSRVPRLTLEPTTQRLGAGTFGDVFQSRLRGGTPVAVKVPKAVTARSLFVRCMLSTAASPIAPASAGSFAGAPPGSTRPSPSASAAITACSAAWSWRDERPPDCGESAPRAPATRRFAATVAAVAWAARSAVFAASVAEEGGRSGGDGKGRRGSAASAFGHARPEAAVFGAAFVSD